MGLPATPATRATRPPAAGPMLRYLSALNSFGDSGFFGVSWPVAPSDSTVSALTAAASHATFRTEGMRASLSSGHGALPCSGPADRRDAGTRVTRRDVRIHL